MRPTVGPNGADSIYFYVGEASWDYVDNIPWLESDLLWYAYSGQAWITTRCMFFGKHSYSSELLWAGGRKSILQQAMNGG